MNYKFLYRGVSLELHKQNKGKLIPKGISLERVVQLNSTPMLYLNSGLTLDSSINNAIVTHQVDSTAFPTSGISTTPHLCRAKYYATHNNSKKGLTYKISVEKLKELNINTYTVKDFAVKPTVPEDDEVIIEINSEENVSENIIVEIIKT